MRDHKKRLVVLPFSMGCATESSVAVGKKTKPKKKKHSAKDILPPPQTTRRKGEKEIKSATKMRNMRSYLTLPKYGFSKGVNRLIKGVKSFSLLPVYKEEEGEEMEQEMEIGLPTDVKHVTHIGWDGSSTVNPVKGWENVQAHEIMSFSSISLKQFELAMVAQASTEPIAVDSTKIR